MNRLTPNSPSQLISLRLTPDMAALLDRRAKREKRSRSDLIRLLIETGLESDSLDDQVRMRRIEREAGELARKMRLGQLAQGRRRA